MRGFADVPRYHTCYHCFTRVEEIRETPAERIGKALWMESEGALFITCARCGEINSLRGFNVLERVSYGEALALENLENVVSPCVYCTKCRSGFAVHLLDWEKVSEKTRKRVALLGYQRKRRQR